jgi:hypothetical protein
VSHILGNLLNQVQIPRSPSPGALCDVRDLRLTAQCDLDAPFAPIGEFRVLA